MPDLSSETILHRAPSMAVELGPDIIIRVGDRRILAGPNVLTILDVFAHPVSFSDAVKTLSGKVTGAQDWMELVSAITTLHKSGVLIDEDGLSPVLGTGWSAPGIHISMLNDRVRTEAFIRAIAAVVRPDDVVVDIGTGTGVLALAAARAGARHVYAIEATEIGRAAQQQFDANGFADRITLLRGWSSQIELPERANVLIAEIIGNDPVEEGVMETFADARKRFLTPDARIIPNRAQVLGIPVTIDEKLVAKYTFTADTLKKWREWYGTDFDSLAASPLNKSVVFKINPHTIRDWPQLSSPVLLADLDLSGTKHPLINESAELTIESGGLLGGLMVYFELDIAPGERISTSPAVAGEECSWAVKIWTSGTQQPVEPGDTFKVAYRYRVDSPGTRIEIIPA